MEEASPPERAPPPAAALTTKDAYNVSLVSLLCTIAAVVAGLFITLNSHSSSTLGFALENLVDTLGSVLILWRFDTNHTDEVLERREVRSDVGLALMFVALGATVSGNAAAHLYSRERLKDQLALLSLAAPSVLLFACLARYKWRVAVAIGSASLKKDAICSFCGALMSLGVLLSYVLDAHGGIWWADAAIAAAVGLGLALYGALVLLRKRGTKWWTRLFWSEGATRASDMASAKRAMADLELPSTGVDKDVL